MIIYQKYVIIMSVKEKQAAAEQTFVFLTPLASESLAKQVKKCESTNSRAKMIEQNVIGREPVSQRERSEI